MKLLLEMLLYSFKKLALSCLSFVGILLLLPPVDTTAQFTQFPPDVLYVSRGGTARFVWDYTVDDRKLEFYANSPQWLFYDQNSKGSLIGSDDRYTNNWDFVISTETCPPRLLNPTRVSRELPATLVISDVTTADSGIYRCTLVLKAGNPIKNQTQLIVTVPPSFSQNGPVKSYEINEHQDLKINCSAVGPPTPNITWVRMQDGFIESRGAGSAVLSINNIKRHQSGIYECQARNNPNENATTTQTNVIVNYKPIISEELSTKNLSSWTGNTITLKCIAHGLPTPNITWYKPGGQQITSGVTNVNNGSQMTITTSEDSADYGSFKCLASNDVGTDEYFVIATQLFTPGSPKVKITDDGIQTSLIIIAWTKPVSDGGSPVIGYKVQINSTRSPQEKYTSNNYVSFSGLKTNQRYEIKVYARNVVGYGNASKIVITTAKQVEPSIKIHKLLNQTVNETQSLVLKCEADGYPIPVIKWKTPTGSVYTGKVYNIMSVKRSDAGTYTCSANNGIGKNVMATLYVTVQYKPVIDRSESSNYSSSWNGNSIRLKCVATGLPAPRITWYKPTNQHISKVVQNLPGDSEVTVDTTHDQGDYGQYKCRATNIVGSDEHIINVTQLFPPGLVHLSIIEIEASSITVKWTTPDIDGGSSVTGYLLEVNTMEPITTVNTNAVITGLKNNTRYTVKVFAKSRVGYGMASSKIINTKKKGKPAVPGLSSTLLQTTGSRLSVNLKWTKPDDNGGIITKYTIYMKDVTIKSDWIKIKDILDLSSLEYSITKNIEIGKTYKFIVTAWNKYGESIKDDWIAKTVNTTADKATYISDKVVNLCAETKYIYLTVIGVFAVILVVAIGLNILLWRKFQLNGNEGKKNIKLRKSQQKETNEEIYDNDLEVEDLALPVVTQSFAQQAINPVPTYEAIQQLSAKTSSQGKPCQSQGPSHYQELNLPSNTSTEEGQRPMYEPLRTISEERTTQQYGQHPYEPLGLRNQNSDYQSLHNNRRESVM